MALGNAMRNRLGNLPSKVPSTTAVPLKSGAGCWTRADIVDVVVMVVLWDLGMMGR
jgi:hypothetical protein